MDRCSQSALSRDEAAAYGVRPKGRLGHAPARGPPSKNTRKVGGLRRGGPCPEACPERREELGSTRRAPCAGAKLRFLAVPAPRRPHTPPSLGPGVSHLQPLHTRSGNMSLVPREQERVATAGRAQPPRAPARPRPGRTAPPAEPPSPECGARGARGADTADRGPFLLRPGCRAVFPDSPQPRTYNALENKNL